MQLFKKIPFIHDEEKFEICIFFEENLINISSFLNHYPANGFRYQIHLPKNIEIEKFMDEEHLDYFIDLAKKDIIENRWQKFSRQFS